MKPNETQWAQQFLASMAPKSRKNIIYKFTLDLLLLAGLGSEPGTF
jgi:hypothetical protein